MTDDRPDHLAPTDALLDVDEYQAVVESDRATPEQVVKSQKYPQPYTTDAASIEDWERELICNGIPVDEAQGYEIRKKGTDADDGRWVRSTERIRNLERMS